MSNINKILQKLNTKNVLVIGDGILDCHITGDFGGKSAEAPISIFKETSVKYIAGGACNVAVNLASAKQNVKFCYVKCNDNNGKILSKLLKDSGVNNVYEVVSKDRKTTLKKRYFIDNTQVFRSDNEDVYSITISEQLKILKYVKNEIANIDIIVISDYGKGVITYTLIEEITKVANINGVKILVDPKTNDFTKYKNCNYIKPNFKEFSEMVKYAKLNEVSINSAVEIAKQNGNDAIIVTLGNNGMFIAYSNGESYSVSGIETDAIDVCGCGDTALSYVAVGVANNLTGEEVISLANVASAKKVGKNGACAVNLSEIAIPFNKVVAETDTPMLKKALENKKIVFTNGCFDIIHAGHIKSLQIARSMGDVLVVGINTDNSIKKLKGEGRPIISLNDRIEVLKALPFVDYIIPFDSETPYNLIKSIIPNVLVKGSEYEKTGIVGEDVVTLNGGEVKYIKMVDGLSTSNIINKIYESKK